MIFSQQKIVAPKQNLARSSTTNSKTDVFHILARGFPWTVKADDVCAFFQNVNIVGGRQGIHITRNVAMEATFFVGSKEDLNKALACDKRQVDSRTIHGT